MNHASIKLLLAGAAITALAFDIFLIFACLIDGYTVHWSLVLAMFFLISVILLALLKSPKREYHYPVWDVGRESATPTYIAPRTHQAAPFVAQSTPRATRWDVGRESATPTYIAPRTHQAAPFVAQSTPRATRSVGKSTPKMPPSMPRNDR